MKLSLKAFVFAAIAVVTNNIHAQEFSLTRNVADLRMWIGGLGQISGNSNLTGITVVETAVINTANNHIRQYGNVVLPSFTFASTTFESTQSFPAQFPNPPTTILGQLTYGFSFPSTSLTFDTGFVPMTWGGSYNVAVTIPLSLPVQQTVSLLTGGVTYQVVETKLLKMNFDLGGAIDTQNYPASIQLSSAKFVNTPTDVYSFIAPNQFAASAYVVMAPEPSSFALLVAGAALVLRSRRSYVRSQAQQC